MSQLESQAGPKRWIPNQTAWANKTAVCIATGPSLTGDQLDIVYGSKCPTVAVNDNYILCPWADIHYAADLKWWRWHEKDALKFRGTSLTVDRQAAIDYGLYWVPYEKHDGLSTNPEYIHTGSNSGYQAINIAYLMGARRIVLIGYDMQVAKNGASHWFGHHPDKLISGYGSFIAKYRTIVPQLDALGLEIINCTINSALDCFPRARLEDALI